MMMMMMMMTCDHNGVFQPGEISLLFGANSVDGDALKLMVLCFGGG